MSKFAFIETTQKRVKPDPDHLVFGTTFADYMFVMDYETGKGWHDGRIVPYGTFELYPSAMVFHYGQTMFEGLKAYKAKDGRILMFRPDMNIKRADRSNKRLCIPHIDDEVFMDALHAVVRANADWVPDKPNTSLYIRPFAIATDPFLGVRPSDTYKFFIICSPVGAYYKEGLNPVKIFIEDEYVRAVKGGIGEAKTGGNYAASLASQVKAHDSGYSQVLWLDGVHRKYIEEVGSMNIFFKINGVVTTPKLNGSILPGVTRDSVLQLCKLWGVPTDERLISIEDVYNAYEAGQLEEVFGTGTAAVISPVGELLWEGHHMVIGDGKTGEFSHKLYNTIVGIQSGEIEGPEGWSVEVK